MGIFGSVIPKICCFCRAFLLLFALLVACAVSLRCICRMGAAGACYLLFATEIAAQLMDLLGDIAAL